MLKAVDEFVRMREITRSVKVALKCLIAVVLFDDDFPYSTSKVEHLVAYTAIFNNICTAHAQKRLFMNFRCKFRHRCSNRRPRFPIRVHNFSDLATFSVDFCILYAECPGALKTQVLENASTEKYNAKLQDKKSLILYKLVWCIFKWGGQVDYRLFFSDIT